MPWIRCRSNNNWLISLAHVMCRRANSISGPYLAHMTHSKPDPMLFRFHDPTSLKLNAPHHTSADLGRCVGREGNPNSSPSCCMTFGYLAVGKGGGDLNERDNSYFFSLLMCAGGWCVVRFWAGECYRKSVRHILRCTGRDRVSRGMFFCHCQVSWKTQTVLGMRLLAMMEWAF